MAVFLLTDEAPDAWPASTVEVALGEDFTGRRVVMLRPNRQSRQDVINIVDPKVIRELIDDLAEGLDHLEPSQEPMRARVAEDALDAELRAFLRRPS